MNTELQDQWLQETRRFWDAENVFEAKYRRICVDPAIESTRDESVLESLWERRTQDELAMLLSGVPTRPEWTCVEIGCGVGRLLRPMAARCRRVIGVDISSRMVEYGREYLSDLSNVEVHLNNGRSLSMIPDGSVDLVYSVLAFQHITVDEVIDAYLSEIARVLRPGGYCRIQSWREATISWSERIKNVGRILFGRIPVRTTRRWEWAPGKQVRFSGLAFRPREWKKRLARHGLKVESLQTGLGHDYWMWTTGRKVQLNPRRFTGTSDRDVASMP